MIKSFIKSNWFCLAAGVMTFVLSLIWPEMDDHDYSVASEMIFQSIIIFSMVLPLRINTRMYRTDIWNQPDANYTLNKQRFIIIFASLAIIMLRGFELLNFLTINKLPLAILLFALINGLVIFQFFEVLHLLISLIKADFRI